MICKRQPIAWIVALLLTTANAASAGELIDVPEVDGKWWQIAPNAPDVGQWATGKENACDFAIFRSDDPLDFNDAELIAHMTGIWYNGKWAPEVIEHEGQFYIAGYGRGLHVARLQWRQNTREEVGAWRKKWLAYLSEEHRKRLERERQRRTGK